MDRNFHTDDFERLLREKSDEFRMYPSKRIWHSVYNNIHPGRKWPSIAMSITLISTLLLVGYLNTKDTNNYTSGETRKIWQQEYARVMLPRYTQNINDYHNSSITSIYADGNVNNKSNTNHFQVNVPVDKVMEKPVNTVQSSALPATVVASSKQITKAITSNQPTSAVLYQQVAGNENISLVDGREDVKDNMTAAITARQMISTQQFRHVVSAIPFNPVMVSSQTWWQAPLINDLINVDLRDKLPALSITGNTTAGLSHSPASQENDFNKISTSDREWIENYALYNRPVTKKWANRLSWQLYATPSVVYRVLYNDPNYVNLSSNTTPLAIAPTSVDINNAVNQTPSIGFEMGTGLLYSIFKGVQLKGGLQLNFTRYNAHAYQNTHPAVTKLTMLDHQHQTSYEVYKTTPYSNKNGLEATKLHNQTIQVSVPIGVDVKLLGNETIQWNLGVTVQPTYVVSGKSYLISSDRRNYVQESSLLNKWNLNAGFETFISIKSNGLTWQVGPQFRSQLMSTNSRKFAIEEKLVNYGIKFGVSKTIH